MPSCTVVSLFFTEVHKWVPAIIMLKTGGGGGYLAMDLSSHPGGVAIFLVDSCYGNRS